MVMKIKIKPSTWQHMALINDTTLNTAEAKHYAKDLRKYLKSFYDQIHDIIDVTMMYDASLLQIILL
jgi:hypothetical protein